MRKIQNDELGRLTVDDFKSSEKRPLVLILDDVRSLNNIGSAFRTADAFRCQSIYLCGITATPPHREIHKTALGAEDSVEWKYEKDVTSAIEILKKTAIRS
jgi:23S rRNA (guanosine2251-2'-O)-methyltransferase